MNHAHAAHYTDHPDPRIKHVLHGWRDDGGPADIDLAVGDMHVTNLPTNIRDGQGGTSSTAILFLCLQVRGCALRISSHLHHLLEPQDIAALGHIDIVMAPVDGAYTLSLPDLMTVLDQIQPRVVLPMHYFMHSVLERFLDAERDKFRDRRADVADAAYLTRVAPGTPDDHRVAGRGLREPCRSTCLRAAPSPRRRGRSGQEAAVEDQAVGQRKGFVVTGLPQDMAEFLAPWSGLYGEQFVPPCVGDERVGAKDRGRIGKGQRDGAGSGRQRSGCANDDEDMRPRGSVCRGSAR